MQLKLKLLLKQSKTENATGYVLIGITDKFADAEKISRKYNTESIKVGNFYITGINGEVQQFVSGWLPVPASV